MVVGDWGGGGRWGSFFGSALGWAKAKTTQLVLCPYVLRCLCLSLSFVFEE
jgi:hypothetical protein